MTVRRELKRILENKVFQKLKLPKSNFNKNVLVSYYSSLKKTRKILILALFDKLLFIIFKKLQQLALIMLIFGKKSCFLGPTQSYIYQVL